MWNPLSWFMEFAGIMGKLPDWQDFVSCSSSAPTFVSLKKIIWLDLPQKQSLYKKNLRDGKCNEEDASMVVPRDISSIKLGDIILADACLLNGHLLKIV
ncbi:putative P-type H(+)-exporting transporter [Helianthus annuus]|nr:putative P-type H(+)-exporting transporter [Helianthus annuus]